MARRFVAEQAARTIGIGLTNVRRGDDANVGICGRIADLASEAIRVLVAYALLAGVITMAAATFRVVRTRFAKFFGAEDIAAIAGRRVAVVATFIGFEDAVATTSNNASIGIGCRIAEFAALAIRILIASANLNIAQTARARRARGASRTKLDQAGNGAAIAGCGIAIIASFAHFENAIATTDGNADIGVGCGIAETTIRAIGILIAGANAPR